MKICATCKVEMRCDKNEVPVELIAGFGPYQMWSTDRWKCPKCGCQILFTGAVQRPVAEHFEADYEEKASYYRQRPGFVQVEVN